MMILHRSLLLCTLIYCAQLVSAGQALAQAAPPTNVRAKIEAYMNNTPAILFDPTMMNLIKGINDADRGVTLLCTNHMIASVRVGLGGSQAGAQYNEHISRVTDVRSEAFLKPSPCLRALASLIRFLPSISIDKKIATRFIVFPVSEGGRGLKYRGVYDGNLLISYDVRSEDADIERDIKTVLGPAMNVNDKELENLILSIIGKARTR